MNEANPFAPPTAAVAVADVGAAPPRGPVIALTIAGVVVITLIVLRMPDLLRLTAANVLNPVVALLILLGTACLAIGLWRAFGDGLRGRKSFVLAIVFLALAISRSVLFNGWWFSAVFVLAIAVALAGVLLVQARVRARRLAP